ncbi:MAG: type I restriction enzyme HsdR N-terminal domain-containing protein [Anaerolineaceae bacterium]|nr:type I restriction enzyme HsdR N-terminal domain-containing protein [Anaerolineaceae bacterium]
MSVESAIRAIAASIEEKRPFIRGEESTKDALIRPMIRALGYDTSNPAEVTAEFVADVGVKQHEAVDYAILKNGEPIILVECKRASASLNNKKHLSQLIRYYNATDARFGILTNGIEHRFYTDLRKRNVMDEKPFLVVNMLELSDDMVVEVCRFAKSEFDAQAIWDLVNTREKEQKELQIIRDNISREFTSPSRDLVRIFARGVLGKGYQKPSEWERVIELTKRALDQHTGPAERCSESSLSPAKTEEEARKERQREAGRKAAETRRRNQEK